MWCHNDGYCILSFFYGRHNWAFCFSLYLYHETRSTRSAMPMALISTCNQIPKSTSSGWTSPMLQPQCQMVIPVKYPYCRPQHSISKLYPSLPTITLHSVFPIESSGITMYRIIKVRSLDLSLFFPLPTTCNPSLSHTVYLANHISSYFIVPDPQCRPLLHL